MEILDCLKRFDTTFTLKKEWVPNITFNTPYEISILESYAQTEECNERILDVLHVTNTNIVEVDMRSWTYTVTREGKHLKLPITRLSSGEKLLVLCHMADITKKCVYVSNELVLLAQPSIMYLMSRFKDSVFVKLVPPTPTIQHILESLN